MIKVKRSIPDVVAVIHRRNGEKGCVALIIRFAYGGVLSNQDIDELLICSRIAKKGE